MWWRILVTNLATNFQDLVAKAESLCTLATVLGAISCPVSSVWNWLWLACEQAHLVCYSHKYLGSGSRWVKQAGKKNGARKSEPARKLLNFEFWPCEVTSLNCQGIKYLTNQQAKQNLNKHDSRFSHSIGSSSLWMCRNTAKKLWTQLTMFAAFK